MKRGGSDRMTKWWVYPTSVQQHRPDHHRLSISKLCHISQDCVDMWRGGRDPSFGTLLQSFRAWIPPQAEHFLFSRRQLVVDNVYDFLIHTAYR